jgi:hypothetical protein
MRDLSRDGASPLRQPQVIGSCLYSPCYRLVTNLPDDYTEASKQRAEEIVGIRVFNSQKYQRSVEFALWRWSRSHTGRARQLRSVENG